MFEIDEGGQIRESEQTWATVTVTLRKWLAYYTTNNNTQIGIVCMWQFGIIYELINVTYSILRIEMKELIDYKAFLLSNSFYKS